jgi:hypothetical protein
MSAKALLSASVSAGPAVYVEDVFSTYLYTGNNSTQTITNGIDLAGEGGLVWTKGRTGTQNNRLIDTTRGSDKLLTSNDTDAEAAGTAGYNITAFNSDGYTLGLNQYSLNSNGSSYASWTFRKAPRFFDVVTYTGTGAARTIAHNLGTTVGSIIIKQTDTISNWYVYHRSLTYGNGTGAYLTTKAGENVLSLNGTTLVNNISTIWNNTDATADVFTVGTNASVNASGAEYVAYIFAHNNGDGGFGENSDQDVIKCGHYVGDGSSLTVDVGFEPEFVIVKKTSEVSDTFGWGIADTMRGFTAAPKVVNWLYANSSSAETTSGGASIYLTANGFKVSNSWSSSTAGYIYIAIRRGPMKTPTDATKVFSAVAYAGNSTTNTTIQNLTTNIAADMAWISHRDSSGQNRQSFDKLRGSGVTLYQSGTYAEENFGSTYAGASVSFSNTQTVLTGQYTAQGLYNTSGNTFAAWNFRRAPGFFDVVAYTGTSVARTVTHNLAAVPELMLVKDRTASASWVAYSASTGPSICGTLNSTSDFSNVGTAYFNSTVPTSSLVTIGANGTVNASGNNYVAYLFATLAGVSKVGSYTGTGTTLSIDCGFTAGARFVLIKRTDSSGDWYVWDTARGIISGNDPYLLLNSSAAEVTNTDYIDPLSSGFQISSTAPAAINASGGSFIFLAIA